MNRPFALHHRGTVGLSPIAKELAPTADGGRLATITNSTTVAGPNGERHQDGARAVGSAAIPIPRVAVVAKLIPLDHIVAASLLKLTVWIAAIVGDDVAIVTGFAVFDKAVAAAVTVVMLFWVLFVTVGTIGTAMAEAIAVRINTLLGFFNSTIGGATIAVGLVAIIATFTGTDFKNAIAALIAIVLQRRLIVIAVGTIFTALSMLIPIGIDALTTCL
tara:strand:+ start:724 stop:1377 length:654 start_codon:yes stop_codon:yes gene_type:complete